ncbi:MAG TPA: translation elongation factor EF-1 subunit alpha [Candidatus Thermoplasmatota archaeon]|nr:translation elongation factor EF-1 subunit alpha [Candidatus Thermoplasmatota archaeon]
MAEKPHMNIVFIGHVDAGKSTTVGRVLLDTGTIEAHIIEKLRKEAEEKGKGGFEFAYVMDNLKEERERGVTIDIAHKKFVTNKYYFTIIDAPGHRDFVKNMITGASQADAAVLVISAVSGIEAQTKEHIFLARTLGVEQLIVYVNKMDALQPAFDQKKFDALKEQIETLIRTVGYKKENVPIIPGSSYKGINITKAPAEMGWFKGPTLLDAMNGLKEPSKPTNLPLRLPVQDVYSITGIGTVPVGRVETGILKIGDTIIFNPSGATGEVKSIEMHHEQHQQAVPGDNVGFNVRGIDKKSIRRGDVAGKADNPPKVAKAFVAQIAVLQHPSVIAAGYTPVFHIHTAQLACTFEELQKKMDPKTGQVKEENPQFLKTGDIAIVKIRPSRPLAIERSKDIPHMSRFAVRDMGTTVAAGLCLDLEER